MIRREHLAKHVYSESISLIDRALITQVPGSRTATSGQYHVQEALVVAPLHQVRRRCDHCPYGAGVVLVLRLRDPGL